MIKNDPLIDPLDLLKSSYQFDLPNDLIAQRPVPQSRLLVYKVKTDEVIHDTFKNLENYLPKDSVLVFNQTKVFPSRLKGKKLSGGKAELFLLSLDPVDGIYPALIKTRSKKNIEDTFVFREGLIATVKQIYDDGTFGVTFNQENLKKYLDQYAFIPIPPYIRNGESDEEDKLAYQTAFAREEGSVAAPTAGLHFRAPLLNSLEKAGIASAHVTLHVGLGTFRPVSAENIHDHKMHSENYFYDRENLEKIKLARSQKKKIFAVGTTTLRVLESSFNKDITPDKVYSTNIFLYPGVDILSVDGLITNFHLPESSLLILVSAMIGRKKALELYKIAIHEKYRFFSYGDGMLIIR